jgi:hypothetical protein
MAVVLPATASSASESGWEFKTPGDAAYCRLESNSFLCVTPNDGFWIRLTGIFDGDKVDVKKGYSRRFRDLHGRAGRVLGFGQVYYSSDAEAVTCWSRRSGLTCKAFDGLSFWLGRFRGYRIYYRPAGVPPRVRPLFRTALAIRCGIAESQEPSNPYLECWRPSDGLVLGIAHDDAGRRGAHSRNENAVGFRPSGFPLLGFGRTLRWRCRNVNPRFAEDCSTGRGVAVFTCTNAGARLTCRNRNKHGFWVSRTSFYTF